MNRYKEANEQYLRVIQQFDELNLEYEGKIKGDAFLKRKMQLQDKADALKKKVRAIGTTGNVIHVHGKRSRPNKNNPKVLVQERFNLYFANVEPDEVSALVKFHVKNMDTYQVTIIRPGQIYITS